MKVEIEKLIPKLKAAIEGQYFLVGVLQNAEHKEAKDKNQGLTAMNEKVFLNGWARRVSAEIDGSTQEIGDELQGQYHWLSNPFRDGNEKQKEIMNFAKTYLADVQSGKKSNRSKNLVQAIVRNPILRGDYGSNAPLTILKKGFDRAMIDTGQFFNSIKAVMVTK